MHTVESVSLLLGFPLGLSILKSKTVFKNSDFILFHSFIRSNCHFFLLLLLSWVFIGFYFSSRIQDDFTQLKIDCYDLTGNYIKFIIQIRQNWQLHHITLTIKNIIFIQLLRIYFTLLRQNSFLYQRRQWQPTPVLLPGESHGWRSLVGCSPWGR